MHSQHGPSWGEWEGGARCHDRQRHSAVGTHSTATAGERGREEAGSSEATSPRSRHSQLRPQLAPEREQPGHQRRRHRAVGTSHHVHQLGREGGRSRVIRGCTSPRSRHSQHGYQLRIEGGRSRVITGGVNAQSALTCHGHSWAKEGGRSWVIRGGVTAHPALTATAIAGERGREEPGHQRRRHRAVGTHSTATAGERGREEPGHHRRRHCAFDRRRAKS